MADPAYIVDGVLTDGEAWVGIATTTLASDTATVTFTSTDDGQVGDWSQYMDLVVVGYCRATGTTYSGDSYFAIRANNETSASLYPSQWLSGDGSSATAFTHTNNYIMCGRFADASVASNVFGSFVCHLFDINSGKYKAAIAMGAGDRDGGGQVHLDASTVKIQAAITELDCQFISGDCLAGSSFSLFGVLPRMVA